MKRKVIALLLAVCVLTTSLFSGCGTSVAESSVPEASISDWGMTATGQMSVAENVEVEIPSVLEEASVQEESPEQSSAVDEILENSAAEEIAEESAVEAPMVAEKDEMIEEAVLSDTQQNSINMLNYLAALVTEINAASDSRVYLEKVYSELINNTDPSVVDRTTLEQYEEILDILEDYRLIEVKRERLEYLHDQNSAKAIREAIPEPLSVLNVVQSESKEEMIVSLLYLIADSASGYLAYVDEEEKQFLQDGWILDDEEATTLHNSRKSMFSYMVRVVSDYDLPGEITLNEKSVQKFVEWKNNTNLIQRIQFLESNKATYSYYGDYWLVLAESYYRNKQPEKCLEAFEQYGQLNNSIFRKDYRLAATIPYAIAAAKETLSDKDYNAFAAEYVKMLTENAEQDNWELQYFAAQVYVELYTNTKDRAYLQSAYNTVLNTTNHLITKQKELNSTYTNDIGEPKIPEEATKEEKQSIKKYYDNMKDARKSELSPVYEPLRLCCELLFSLAEELNISNTEKQRVDGLLREENQNLFLDSVLDDVFRFDHPNGEISEEDIDVQFDGTTIIIPGQYVSAISTIKVSSNGDEVTDWAVQKVDRNKSKDVSDFVVTFKSNNAKDVEYADGDVVVVEVSVTDNVDPLTFSFLVEKTTILGLDISTKFVRI